MSTAAALADVDAALGLSAPLPRANGELVFEEVWQGRALGLGVVVLERTRAPWSEFRDHLVAAITRACTGARRVIGDRLLHRLARRSRDAARCSRPGLSRG
jgi:hypothetical protein